MAEENENERTLFVGNLSDKVTDEILWELFLQAGPLTKVKIPNDGRSQKSFGFVTFRHSMSVPYTIALMDGIRLFGRSLRLQSRTGSSHSNIASPDQQWSNPDLNRSKSLPNPQIFSPPLENKLSLPPPINMPPIPISFQDSPHSSPASTPTHEGSSNFNERSSYSNERHERRRSNDHRHHRHDNRYDPRHSRDSSNNRNETRRLSQQMNLNPNQRHMQPSSRRKHWNRH